MPVAEDLTVPFIEMIPALTMVVTPSGRKNLLSRTAGSTVVKVYGVPGSRVVLVVHSRYAVDRGTTHELNNISADEVEVLARI